MKNFFLPVTNEVYDWYINHGKEWELRSYTGRFNERQLCEGRLVTVARGYSTPDRFEAEIVSPPVIGSVDTILNAVPYKLIIPVAVTEEEARKRIADFVSGEVYIASHLFQQAHTFLTDS